MADQKAAMAPSSVSRRKVLLIDNEADAASVYGDLLRHWGYDVVEARSSAEAFAQVGQQEFDVIVLELRMPEGASFRLLEEIRTYRPHCPVIAASRIPSVGTVVQAFKSGAADYLGKPFTASEIRSKIEEVLRRQNVRKEEASILRLIGQGAARLLKLSSQMSGRLHACSRECLPDREIESIVRLSDQLSELCARLLQIQSHGAQLREFESGGTERVDPDPGHAAWGIR
jgi:DNA-binding response OmpR family regulator